MDGVHFRPTAARKPVPKCGGVELRWRGEKGRTKKANGQQQKVAKNADCVFAPGEVEAVEVKDLAAVESEGSIDREDQAGDDACNRGSAPGAPREKCEEKKSGQAAGDDGCSGVVESEG